MRYAAAPLRFFMHKPRQSRRPGYPNVRIIGPLFGVKAYQQADTPIPDAVAPQFD